MYLQKKTNIDVDDDDEFNHDIDYEEGLLQILKYPKITNLIKAEISDGSKDYDIDYIRSHVDKLTF